MDYLAAQKLAAKQITSFGTKVTIAQGGNTAKVSGLFTTASNNDFADQGGPISGVTSAQRMLLIPGNVKLTPAVGDIVTSKQGVFRVLRVELVQPGDIPVLYKLEVTQ